MFTEHNIDQLLSKFDRPELEYYEYAVGASVEEGLSHSADDFRFWTNRANKPILALYKKVHEMRLQRLWEPVAELVANSLRHGNAGSLYPAPNGDPLKSLSVKVFTANNGVLFRVRSDGEGFDYTQVIAKVLDGEKHSKSVLGGNGMRMLMHPALLVSYEDEGRVSNLLYLAQ